MIGNRESETLERITKKMKIKSYKELDVWKKGIEIVDYVYEVTNKFPTEERYEFDKEFKNRGSVNRRLWLK